MEALQNDDWEGRVYGVDMGVMSLYLAARPPVFGIYTGLKFRMWRTYGANPCPHHPLRVAAADVGDCAVACIDAPAARGATFSLYLRPSPGIAGGPYPTYFGSGDVRKRGPVLRGGTYAQLLERLEPDV